MNYDVSSLTTVADCDSLLAMAAKEKETLQYRRTILDHSQTIVTTSGTGLEGVLQSVATELAPMAATIAAMPDGKDKRDAVTRQKRLELKQAILTNKKYQYGALAQMENLLDLGRNQQELDTVDQFIADVTAKKATL